MKNLSTLPITDDTVENPQLTEAEKHKLCVAFNNNEVYYPIDMTVIDLFEEQVKQRPNSTAVIFDEQKLTYKELNEYANKLANYLKDKGLTEETLVPICIERSLLMIVSILGVMKASCAYVPIDTDYPEERIRYILEDTAARLVITSKESRFKLETLQKFDIDIIELDATLSIIDQQAVKYDQSSIKTYRLAYVIYTSGSTGKPKGVMIEHEGLTNLSLSQADFFGLKPGMKTLQFASFGFDASCSEIFTALISGGCLVVTQKKDILSAEEFENIINKHEVEVVTLPPSYQHVVKDRLGTLKTIISAGEQLNETLGRYLQSKGIRLINAYGPTENTVCVSMSDDPIKENHVVVIGKPISNVEVYIVNEKGDLCPAGITGEIWVSGVQVARGYFNKPNLTAEKFIEDPFKENTGRRLYKTGDLGRWLSDGNIEFLGRMDDQVKIRGYRIELGEVESILNQCGLVKQAVVLAKEDKKGNKYLVAYIIPVKALDKKAVITYLKNKLPEYMIPTVLMEVQSFSITPNGKIDKKALPEPDARDLSNKNFVPPHSKVEQELADIWKDVFQIDQIGKYDNFFNLGGNSLRAVEIVSYANRKGYNLKPSDFFTSQTVEELSRVITARTQSKLSAKTESDKKKKWIIPMKNGGNKIPFFFMSPGFSVYDKVVPSLDKEQPFYFFIPYSYKKVEDIASHYIREMKKIHPVGPYCLGGYCGFGEVALEMAQQLTAEGEKVAFLALFEFYSPDVMKPFDLKERIQHYYHQLGELSIQKKMMLFYELMCKQVRRVKKRTSKVIDTKIRNLPDKSGYLIGKGLYSAKPYHGKVLLFKSSIKTIRIMDSDWMGWSEHFDNVELFTIEGNHKTMFYNPGSIQIAEKLNAYAFLELAE
jgi:amino acid adenylation domain-containing protein